MQSWYQSQDFHLDVLFFFFKCGKLHLPSLKSNTPSSVIAPEVIFLSSSFKAHFASFNSVEKWICKSSNYFKYLNLHENIFCFKVRIVMKSRSCGIFLEWFWFLSATVSRQSTRSLLQTQIFVCIFPWSGRDSITLDF